jgi:hypothetical protein
MAASARPRGQDAPASSVERAAIGALAVEALDEVAPVAPDEAVVARAAGEGREAQAGLHVRARPARGLELRDVVGGDRLVGRDQDRQPDELLLELAQRAPVEGQRRVGLVVGAREARRGQREEAMVREQVAALGAHRLEDREDFLFRCEVRHATGPIAGVGAGPYHRHDTMGA